MAAKNVEGEETSSFTDRNEEAEVTKPCPTLPFALCQSNACIKHQKQQAHTHGAGPGLPSVHPARDSVHINTAAHKCTYGAGAGPGRAVMTAGRYEATDPQMGQAAWAGPGRAGCGRLARDDCELAPTANYYPIKTSLGRIKGA